MLAYFMIALSIALIIGSWMWLAPTVHQKKLAKLRQGALESGYKVKFVSRESYLEMAKPHTKRQVVSDKQIVRYTFTNQGSNQFAAKKPTQKLLFLFDAEGRVSGFFLDGKEMDLSKIAEFAIEMSWLESLSQHFKDLLAVELIGYKGCRSLSLYWQEQGELEQTRFNLDALEALKTV